MKNKLISPYFTHVRPRLKRAFSLLEVAIVLGVIGVALGGIWVAHSAVTENLKANELAAGLLTACDRAANAMPASLAPATIIQMPATAVMVGKIYPSSWLQNGTVTSPIGTIGMTHWLDTSQGADFQGEVRLNVYDLTQSQCLKIGAKLSRASSSLVRNVTIGTGAWITQTPYTLPYTGSFDSACDDASLIHIEIACTARR